MKYYFVKTEVEFKQSVHDAFTGIMHWNNIGRGEVNFFIIDNEDEDGEGPILKVFRYSTPHATIVDIMEVKEVEKDFFWETKNPKEDNSWKQYNNMMVRKKSTS